MSFLNESEKEFQSWVTDAAALYGWEWRHIADSRKQVGDEWVGDHDARDWPDLMLWKPTPGRFHLIELKTKAGRVSKGQRETIDQLRLAGVSVSIWRPEMRDSIFTFLASPRAGDPP